MMFVQSSYIGSQYSVFFIPSLYRFTKSDSRCIARIGGGEHRHGMGVARHRPEDVEHVLGHVCPRLEVLDDFERLLFRRNVAREEEVPEPFHVRIVAPGHLGQRRERLGDRLAAEADPLLRVEVGDVGHEAADVAGAADALVDGHLVDHDLPLLLDQLGRARTVGQDLLQEFRLEVRHGCASPFVGFFCNRCHGPCLLSGGIAIDCV